MAQQVDFLDAVVDIVEQYCNLPCAVSTDALSDGGIYAEFDSGMNESIYYDKSAVRIWPVSFLVKNIDQKLCVGTLDSICNYLQHLKQYPQHDGFIWIYADVQNYPVKVARQEDGQYIYSCTIINKVYF